MARQLSAGKEAIMSLEITSHIGCMIINKVAGKYSSGYQREIERFLSSNGPEWTVNRLKACWNAALHLKGGCPDLAKEVYQQNSISYHKDTMVPKGPIGPVVRTFVEARQPAVMRRWAAVLRFYTGIRLTETSWKQFKKAQDSINSPLSVPTEQMESLSKQIVDEVLKAYGNPKAVPEVDNIYADQLRGTAKYFSPLRVPKEVRAMPYSSMTLSLITTAWVPDSLDYQTPCQEMRQALRRDPAVNDKFIGRISFIQESGCKGRVVAQPSAWLQLAFMPLHKTLVRFTNKHFGGNTCVYDQEGGIWVPIQRIASGENPVSVDLSSATDRLPRFLQTYLLERIGLENYAQALEDVCQRPFVAEWKGMQIPFFYRVGQPMGLYGSFPLLNLSNIVIAKYSELHSGFKPREGVPTCFYVLGDDIVFLDNKAADIYKSVLVKLGVEVSPTKCRSGRVAEFAGFTILPTNRGATAFRPYKLPGVSRTITNPVEFLHAMGIKARSLSSKWERYFDAYQRGIPLLSPCLSPLVSEEKDPMSSTFRADNRWMISMTNHIYGTGLEGLPDLDSNTKINRLPLFREQRQFDFYGFNPEKYKESDVAYAKAMKMPGVSVYRSVEQHPVLREALTSLDKEDRLKQLESELTVVSDFNKKLDILKEIQQITNSMRKDRKVSKVKEPSR
jgi:hypothetical protein